MSAGFEHHLRQESVVVAEDSNFRREISTTVILIFTFYIMLLF